MVTLKAMMMTVLIHLKEAPRRLWEAMTKTPRPITKLNQCLGLTHNT